MPVVEVVPDVPVEFVPVVAVPVVEVIVVSVVEVIIVSVIIVEDVSVEEYVLEVLDESVTAVPVVTFRFSSFLHAKPNSVIDATSRNTAVFFIFCLAR